MADPTVEKLSRILAELGQHKRRLAAKVKQISELSKGGAAVDGPALLKLIEESFSEQVDTGLDFLVDVVETIVEELKNSPPPGLDAGDGDEEVEAGIEPEDAETILTALNGYRGMLEAYIEQVKAQAGVEPSQVADLELRKTQCLTAIDVTEGLVLVDDEGEDEDDDGEDEADDAPAPAGN